MEEKNVLLYYKIDVLEQKLSNYDNMDTSCSSNSTNDDQMRSTRGATKRLGMKSNARSLSSHMAKKLLPEPAPMIEEYQTGMTAAEPAENTGSTSSSTTARHQKAVETAQNYKEGGVAIYLKRNMNYKTVELSKFCIEKQIEMCAVRFNEIVTHFPILKRFRRPNMNKWVTDEVVASSK
nr:unnamed protein product [Callosobruchus analis]